MLLALSHAWASWKTTPGVALLAVVAFAVGIGSATAIFTVINGVLLRPLPYPDSERFVALSGARTTQPGIFMAMSGPEVREYEQQTTSFDAFGWFRGGRFHLTAPGEPQFVRGAAVTPGLARQLGSPLLGQWFTDDTSAVLSSALWRRLGARRDIIGTAITLDDRRYIVSGVMPPAFRLPIASLGMGSGNNEVWIPLASSPADQNRGSGRYFAYARRKPGVSLEQAQADAKRVAAIIAATDPTRYQFYTSDVVGLRESTVDALRPSLLILLGGAGLLLLIACANVATLLLARSVIRARETAVRVALGASRRQLALQYFAEGALVSIAGAAAGVGLSAIFVQQMLIAAAAFIPRSDLIRIDWKVLGFSVAVAVTTGLLASLAPLWQATRTAPNAVLTDGVRASAAAPVRRFSKAFVVAEIALAFTLLTMSAILVVHLRNLGRVPLGYDAEGIVTFELALPRTALPQAGGAGDVGNARRREQDRLIAALRQTPGATGVAFASQLPTFGGGTAVYAEGRPADAVGQRVLLVQATPDYLSTMRIPLRAGRWLNESDNQSEPLNVVVNEAAARAYWPGRDPIGASGRLYQADGDRFSIVGVVGDVRNFGLNRPSQPELYLAASAPNPMYVVVRSTLPTDQLIGTVRRVLRQANPLLPIDNVRTLTDVVSDTLQLERLSSMVMTFFALAALLMATLGIYGLMSYFVRQRTVELGTRMALGADHRDLVALVVGDGVKLSLAGVAVGVIALGGGVWLLVRVLDVANVGWLPFASSTAVVAFVGVAATSVPAWRTTLLTPMAAMREQPASVWGLARQRMQHAAREIREAIGGDDTGSDVSAADVLTAFVEAARSADSHAGALRGMLTSMCDALHVQSAALLARRDRRQTDLRCLVAAGALDAVPPAITAEGFLISRLRTYPRPLPFAPNELAALAEWAAAHRPEWLDEIRALAAAGVRVAVPLRTRWEILGVLLLGERAFDSRSLAQDKPQRAGFSAHERQVLLACADQFALVIENGRLTDRVVQQETLRRDVALASEVQRRLLPGDPPRTGGADFAALSVPARRIGGDYYDFLELGDGVIGLALADVSGKGVAAALIMSAVQAALRIISSEGDVPPPRLVARINEFVYRSTPESKYATLFFAQFDGGRRQLRYVNAGHNAPFLLRAVAGRSTESALPDIEQLSVGGTVVGMFPEMRYDEATVDLRPGDVLLAFTDGVPEAHNSENEEFGDARLQQLLRQAAHLSANEISARISAEMKNWIGDAEQYDDLTFVVMKVR
jgi:putative ABC transport system permease protein